MKRLLVEKYRPNSTSGYLFNNKDTERKVNKWVKEQEIPNVLLSGSAGTGKTTLSRILVNELAIQDNDVFRVNASLENGIGFIREQLEPWCKRSGFSNFKVVILEESDQLSAAAQKALRDVTESFSDRIRWIFTCNHPERIHPALLSRCQHIHINEHSEESVIDLVLDIIEAEAIVVDDVGTLMSHIDTYMPDIRKIINSVDGSVDEHNVLHKLTESATGVDIDEWVSLWSQDQLDLEAALKVAEGVDQNNYEWFYEVMYSNSLIFPNEANAVVMLSTYLDRAQRAANQRLHLTAFLYHAFILGAEDE